MKKLSKTLLRVAAAVSLLTTALPAHATLLDHGPGDPVLTFPIWYRDLNGLAVKPCLSTSPSPNAALAAGKPMCFPINPDPAGFAGNVGPEVFYNALTVGIGKGAAQGSSTTFAMTYVASLEGSYLPSGVPIHGTESLFARIRIVANIQATGLYKVTHPFGVELFDIKAADLGARGIFFTADVPVGIMMNFDAALAGRVGPWIQWDFVDPGVTLTNAAGEQFLADPNVSHTYAGSPFGTNFIRVDGPVGSNLDGVGNDFIQSPLGTVVGQKYLAPIPTPLSISRASYSRDPVRNITSIDVFAKTAPGAQMLLTGNGMPSVTMTGDALGNYVAHVEMPATVLTPASITVTNSTSVPPSSATAGLIDVVTVTTASFDTLTRALSVTAKSSDLSTVPPAMSVAGPLGGLMTAGALTTTVLPGVLYPSSVTVNSAAGGTETELVTVLPGLPDNKATAPVAVADVVTTPENTAVAISVTANDVVVAPATLGSVVVVQVPLNGKAVVAATGVVTYTPNASFFGADNFQYVVIDSTGQVSNIATVGVTVTFVAVGPTANADDFAMLKGTSRTVSVIANDVATAGTSINPASVVITTRPLHGTAVPNAAGGVTYTPLLAYVGSDSFAYTVANNAAVASAPATVSVVVEGGPESLSISKANFTVKTSKWNIVGSTNWFGPTLNHTTATCYIGRGLTGAVIGTTPVDNTGKFALVPPTLTTPPPDATNIFTCQTSNGGIVSAVVQLL
jgi:Big-like domain-containing protein